MDDACSISAQSTREVLLGINIDRSIVERAVRHNFASEACPACPSAVDVRLMNTVRRQSTSTVSPFGQPQEHGYSTGIRDGQFPDERRMQAAEDRCLGGSQVWDRTNIACFQNLWDRAASDDPSLLSTNDVNARRIPADCAPTQSGCSPLLRSSIADFLHALAPLTGAISRAEFRAAWLTSELSLEFQQQAELF